MDKQSDRLVDALRFARLAICPSPAACCLVCEIRLGDQPLDASGYVSALAVYADHELLGAACALCSARYHVSSES